MAISITKKTATANTTAKSNRSLEWIVCHYTAGVTSEAGVAINTANYFSRPTTQASADFIVDETYIVQYNPDIKNRYCWHCGDGSSGTYGGKCYNSNSIGVEICSSNTTGQMTQPCDSYYYFTDKVLNKAEELIKYLMVTYNIPADHIIRHYDVSRKSCPGVRGWLDNSYGNAKWTAFKARFTKTTTTAPTTTTTTTTTSTGLYRVRKTWANAASQIGAYAKLENAKSIVDKNPGYYVFDSNGKCVYPVATTGTGSATATTKPGTTAPTTVKLSAADAKSYTTKLLGHYPFTYCPTLAAKTSNHTPHKGDIVLFYQSGDYEHTGYVYAADSTYFYTIEGNTSGANGVVANGGGVCKKSYKISSYTQSKFYRPDYSILVKAGIYSSADSAINAVINTATNEVGYLEKASNSNLDSKTGNAGYNNYTKYWRDIYPGCQGQPWCAAFVTWILQKTLEGQSATSGSGAATSTTTSSSYSSGTDYDVAKKYISTYGAIRKWQNGSTEEAVYGDSNCSCGVGALDPGDSAVLLGIKNNRYIVAYNVSGSSNLKVGFVTYAGGSYYTANTSKTWRNGSTDETVYSDTYLNSYLGSLDPYESCQCLGTLNGKYIVLYQVGSSSNYKVGLVDYAGGL